MENPCLKTSYASVVNSKSLYWNHIIDSGSNMILVVGIQMKADNLPALNIESVSANTIALDYITDSSVTIEDDGIFYRNALYYLANPIADISTIEVEAIGTCMTLSAGAVTLKDVYQGIPETVVTNAVNDSKVNCIDVQAKVFSKDAVVFGIFCSSSESGCICESSIFANELDERSKNRSFGLITKVSETSGIQHISCHASKSGCMAISCAVFSPYSDSRKITIAYDKTSFQQKFGLERLEKTLLRQSYAPVKIDNAHSKGDEDIIVTVETESNIAKEGFKVSVHGKSIKVIAGDEAGAMYGLLELAEVINLHGLYNVRDLEVSPKFPLRAIKHNTPWSSYRTCRSIDQHFDTIRDVFYWEGFLDMMAENRYNALSIFNLHPFPYMIRPVNFPKATPFSEEELSQWQFLYRRIFEMAKQRNIETYLVTWNIFVSDAFKEHYDNDALTDTMGYKSHNSYNSPLIEKYTKECVTQIFNEYPDLTGIGISLGENMGGMNAVERDEWAKRTFIAGAQAADRQVKLIYRAPFSAGLDSDGSTSNDVEVLTRNSIESIENVKRPLETEIKFNWSHGYSSDRLIQVHGGGISDIYWSPLPPNYRIGWMIRNEDFFILRWGQPEFIRRHIKNNGQDYVGGYYIGSEGYYPALNYIDKERVNSNKNRFGFNRQWLLYMTWGRLLYDINTSDETFELAFDNRYGEGIGKTLLKAYKYAGSFPQLFGSFIYSTWDFTAYAEGFLCPVKALHNDNNETASYPFLSVTDLMEYKVLDQNYLSIKEFTSQNYSSSCMKEGRTTPLELADLLEQNAAKSLDLIENLASDNPGLEDDIGDIQAWSYLSLYFADKLRAAVALALAIERHNEQLKKDAVHHIKSARNNWKHLVEVTKHRYKQALLIHTSEYFSWEKYLKDAEMDIDIILGTEVE